jgi:hypothetical protein
MTYDVTLQVKLNGGAPQTGDVYANLNDVAQLTAASKNWPLNPAPRWEIYDYPDSFALPASWTQDTDDATKPSYYALGSADPPPFTINPWGRYRTRLWVGGSVVDSRTFIKCLSTNGLEEIARTEGPEFGGQKQQWTRALNKNTRLIDAALGGGAGVASLASGGGITATGTGSPATGPVTLGSNANSSAMPSTIAEYDSSGNLVAAGFLLPGSPSSGITQGAAAGGNGDPATFKAQSGPSAGKAGGVATVAGGDGGTPGTDAAGGVTLQLGQAITSSGISKKLSIQTAAATEVCSFQQTATATYALTTGTSAQCAMTYGAVQAASGAGGDTFYKPQRGHSAGTDASGKNRFDDGPSVGGVTSGNTFEDNGSVYGTIHLAGGFCTFTGGNVNVLTAGDLFLQGSTEIYIYSSAGSIITQAATSEIHYSAGGSVAATDVFVVGISTRTWASGVTQIQEILPLGTGCFYFFQADRVEVQGQITSKSQALGTTSAVAWDTRSGQNAHCIATANVTALSLTNSVDGGRYELEFVPGGSKWTLAFSGVTFPTATYSAAGLVTLCATANTIICLIRNKRGSLYLISYEGY